MQRSPHVNNLCRRLRNLRGFVTSYIEKEQFEVTDDSELSKPTFLDSAWLRNLKTIEQLSRDNQRPSSKTDNTAYKRITSCQYKFLSEDVISVLWPYRHSCSAWQCDSLHETAGHLGRDKKIAQYQNAIYEANPAMWLVYLYHVIENILLWLAMYQCAPHTTDEAKSTLDMLLKRE